MCTYLGLGTSPPARHAANMALIIVISTEDFQIHCNVQSTIFVARQMYLFARHDFHVALEVTIYQVSQKKSMHAFKGCLIMAVLDNESC